MADLNKGAVQTTIKRLQIITNKKNVDLIENGHGIIHYRINNYDFAKQDELKRIIIAKYGIQTDRKDLFFDGIVGDQLAKIVDLDRPLNLLDIQIIKDEIRKNRPDETRDITVFCNGSERRCCMNSIGCILVECCFLVSCFFLPYTTGVCPDGSCD